MARIQVIMEDDNGNTLTTKSYDLGADFINIDKVEDAVLSISGGLMSDITQHILTIEQDNFLKK